MGRGGGKGAVGYTVRKHRIVLLQQHTLIHPTLAATTPPVAAAHILKTEALRHRLLLTMTESAVCGVRVARLDCFKMKLDFKMSKRHFVLA